MTRSLFRPEATEAQRQRLFGEVVVAQPLSFWVLTIFLAAVLVALAVFLTTGSFARKENALGFLQPDKGIVRVFAPTSGVVTEVLVREGETVEAGAPLLGVLAERITSAGRGVDATMLETVATRLEEVERQMALGSRQQAADTDRLRAEIAGLDAEIRQINEQIGVQTELVEVAIENLDAIEDLTRRGVVSETEYKARQERVLGYRQQAAALRQQLAATGARLARSRLDLERLPIDMEERMSQLAGERATLLGQKAEIEGRRALTLTAPVAGKVTALQAVVGAAVGDTPLLAILPEGGVLEAHLFVPTRAIGFVSPGQKVRLAYDAFDYRRFGVHDGIVREVSATILSPAEVPGPVTPEEPVYRVTVSLDRQDVPAFGNHVPLQAGMTLSADIILEERSLLDWLLEPLLSLRGRV